MKRVLLVSGSTREGSTNTAVLRTAAAGAAPDVRAVLYDGLAALPAFSPDDDTDPLPPAVADLRRQLAGADAVLFCTPEYAGALPGSMKNLLDWTVGGGEIYRQPVAWINCASVAAPTGGGAATAELATVLGYVGADIVEPACLRLPLSRRDVAADGLLADPQQRAAVGEVLHTLLLVATQPQDPATAPLDGRRFAGAGNTAGGEVDGATIFHYREAGGVVEADYAGGAIRRGFLVGTRAADRLDFRYAHLSEPGQTAAGHCRSRIVVLPDGRLRMYETWEWESRDGSGTSVVEESPSS